MINKNISPGLVHDLLGTPSIQELIELNNLYQNINKFIKKPLMTKLKIPLLKVLSSEKIRRLKMVSAERFSFALNRWYFIFQFKGNLLFKLQKTSFSG
jgi:hypothetical protein